MARNRKCVLTAAILTLLLTLTACGSTGTSMASTSESNAAAVLTANENSELKEEPEVLSEIRIVPESYNSPAAHQGTIETFTYSTGNREKTAYAYLPYGYDASGDMRYNILYFMHGGGRQCRSVL